MPLETKNRAQGRENDHRVRDFTFRKSIKYGKMRVSIGGRLWRGPGKAPANQSQRRESQSDPNFFENAPREKDIKSGCEWVEYKGRGRGGSRGNRPAVAAKEATPGADLSQAVRNALMLGLTSFVTVCSNSPSPPPPLPPSLSPAPAPAASFGAAVRFDASVDNGLVARR